VFAGRHGVSRVKLTIGSFVEAGIQIVVMLLLAAIFLAIDPRRSVIDVTQRVLLGVVALFGVVVLMPPVFNRIVALGLRLLRRGPLSSVDEVTFGTVLKGAAQYVVSSIATGLATFGIALAVAPELQWNDLVFVIASTCVAGAAGMLAVFVPSGIGVREAVMIACLSVVLPVETAILASIVTRLWSIIVDLLFLASSLLVARIFRRRRERAMT
jgi:glycosyltransferase 2 family protein